MNIVYTDMERRWELHDEGSIRHLFIVAYRPLSFSIIVHIDVANVDDERMVNALEHIWIQLRLDASHRTRLSVTLSINHVDNTVVFHCLNIGNVTDCNSLASHTTTNQEYIGRGQTLVWYFLFCN